MTHPTQRDSEIVVELAQTFVAMMNEQYPGWSRAFFRFNASQLSYGGAASFERGNRVDLFDSFQHPEGMDYLIKLGHELWDSRRDFKVILLIVKASLDYTIHFEAEDERRWAISKMDGGTGVPVGLP